MPRQSEGARPPCCGRSPVPSSPPRSFGGQSSKPPFGFDQFEWRRLNGDSTRTSVAQQPLNAGEPVAGCRFRDEVPRMGRIFLNLSAQSRDIDVHVVHLGLVGGPPDFSEDHAVGEEPPFVPGKERKELEFVRRQLHRRFAPENGTFVEIDSKLSYLDDRPIGLAAPPEGGAESGEELVDGEGLRHIVVRTGVQSLDLLVLVTDDREEEDRDLRPSPQLPTNVYPAPVRQHEIKDHRIRKSKPGSRERLLATRSRVGLVARAPQDRLERREDVGLVVDGEDSGAPHGLVPRSTRSPAGRGSAAAGSAIRNDAPCPQTDSAQIRPPLASTNPFAIARPRPAPLPPPVVEACWKGSNTRSSSPGGSPGP